MKASVFETYPGWMVAVCNGVGLTIYAIGFYLVCQLGRWWGLAYLAYGVWMEARLLTGSCRRCYYYGKRCAFGKGRVCSWLFTRQIAGAESKPCTWWNVVPDFLVSVVPLGVGIVLVVRSFSWFVLLLLGLLLFLASIGTGFVRGQLACPFCKQRELGCSAEALFRKAQKR
jgi:hypothetical protein